MLRRIVSNSFAQFTTNLNIWITELSIRYDVGWLKDAMVGESYHESGLVPVTSFVATLSCSTAVVYSTHTSLTRLVVVLFSFSDETAKACTEHLFSMSAGGHVQSRERLSFFFFFLGNRSRGIILRCYRA